MSFCSFFGGEVFQNHFEPGVYVCAKCGYELFSSRSKYAHSSPWPAFTETIHADSVAKHPERNSPTALKRERQRERKHKQGSGRGRSRLPAEQGARCGARSQDPGITP
uniref:Methionine-R-sulfoxide reductase B1 n=1 Tax=Ursus maritimus TaxID=29073 RepID=A0A452VAI4_URSMA